MRVLIVGGSSSLCRALMPVVAEFAEVITAGRRDCDIRLDLDAPDRIDLPKDLDVVINTAASFGGTGSDDMVTAESVNALGVLRLCDTCARARTRHLVLISSIFAGLDQSSPFYSIYALSKRHGDELAQLFCANAGLPLTILRPSQFYGNDDAAQRKHQPFLSSIIDKAEADEDIPIYGTRDPLRNFIHVEDVAGIIAAVIRRRVEGLYACMHPRNVSYSEVAGAAVAAFGSRSVVKFLPDKPDVPDNVFEIDDSLYRRICYLPQISIASGMRKVAAQRKHPT